MFGRLQNNQKTKKVNIEEYRKLYKQFVKKKSLTLVEITLHRKLRKKLDKKKRWWASTPLGSTLLRIQW